MKWNLLNSFSMFSIYHNSFIIAGWRNELIIHSRFTLLHYMHHADRQLHSSNDLLLLYLYFNARVSMAEQNEKCLKILMLFSKNKRTKSKLNCINYTWCILTPTRNMNMVLLNNFDFFSRENIYCVVCTQCTSAQNELSTL